MRTLAAILLLHILISAAWAASVAGKLADLKRKVIQMGLKQAQFDAAISSLNTATNAIAARLQKLIDDEGDVISQESLDALTADVANLQALGADPNNPVPPQTTPPAGTTSADTDTPTSPSTPASGDVPRNANGDPA